VDVQLIRKGSRKTVKLELSKREEMEMNFHGCMPDMKNFNFDHYGFDGRQFHEQMRDIMKDLKPEMDRIRKHVRIRVEDGKVIKEETEEKEEGTEL